MKCENYLCIYEENEVCTLNNIELDVQGQCKECIYIKISERELQQLKQQTKNDLEK